MQSFCFPSFLQFPGYCGFYLLLVTLKRFLEIGCCIIFIIIIIITIIIIIIIKVPADNIRCASAANVFCRDFDVFRNHNVFLEHILL
jgi:hypothetical protein